MGLEIEAKMRLRNPVGVTHRLKHLGGKFVSKIHETNTYLDTAEQSLRQIDEGLRVRREQHYSSDCQPINNRTVITHKGPRQTGKFKTREENEYEADDMIKAIRLFNALGYQSILCFEKRRERWQLNGCLIELDTLPLIGQFIEIEGESVEKVDETREMLELSDERLITTSYIVLLLDAVIASGQTTDQPILLDK